MAIITKLRTLRWTDSDRIRLVEAVMKVEQETARASQNSVEKWDAIADLLPPEVGEKHWNPNKQMYNHPKCCGMFHNLLKAYRDKAEGKVTRNSRWRLSVPLMEILKRREDLRERRWPVLDRTFSRSVAPKYVDARLHQDRNLNQKQISPTGDSSFGRDVSRLKRGTRGSDKKVKWTEASRLQVINAVIQLEMNGSEGGCNFKGKWSMIANLLPPALRERVGTGKRAQGEHKCCRVFYNLMSAYKRSQSAAGNDSTSGFGGVLTKDVVELLKKREELLNGSVITQDKKKSFRRSKDMRTDKNSHKLSLKPWDVAAASKPYANIEESSPGQSTGSGRGTGTCSFSQKAAESESEGSKEAPQNDGNVIVTSDHIARDRKSVDRQTASCFLRLKKPRSVSEFQDPANDAEPDGSWSGVETRAQARAKLKDCNSATSRPAGEPTASRPKRPRTSSRSQTPADDAHLRTVLDRSLKRIDREFPDLSSWLQSQATRDEFKSRVALLAARCTVGDDAKRARVGEMIDASSLSKMIDHQVQALFYKLRIRIAVELNSACEKIAHEVSEGTQILRTSHQHQSFGSFPSFVNF